MPVLAVNKRATFDYDILEKYEAGVILFGHEVKSAKSGHINLSGSYVTFKTGPNALPEAFLTNASIPLYKRASTIEDYNPDRPRKLLLNKQEIKRLLGKKQEQGLTLVPLKIYTKHSLIKLEFGLGRGRKKVDKRELIKKRDIERDLRTLTKKKQRS